MTRKTLPPSKKKKPYLYFGYADKMTITARNSHFFFVDKVRAE